MYYVIGGEKAGASERSGDRRKDAKSFSVIPRTTLLSARNCIPPFRSLGRSTFRESRDATITRLKSVTLPLNECFADSGKKAIIIYRRL